MPPHCCKEMCACIKRTHIRALQFTTDLNSAASGLTSWTPASGSVQEAYKRHCHLPSGVKKNLCEPRAGCQFPRSSLLPRNGRLCNTCSPVTFLLSFCLHTPSSAVSWQECNVPAPTVPVRLGEGCEEWQEAGGVGAPQITSQVPHIPLTANSHLGLRAWHNLILSSTLPTEFCSIRHFFTLGATPRELILSRW